jgi:hypothetical protein
MSTSPLVCEAEDCTFGQAGWIEQQLLLEMRCMCPVPDCTQREPFLLCPKHAMLYLIERVTSQMLLEELQAQIPHAVKQMSKDFNHWVENGCREEDAPPNLAGYQEQLMDLERSKRSPFDLPELPI